MVTVITPTIGRPLSNPLLEEERACSDNIGGIITAYKYSSFKILN
jgi:hypothetical protein